MKKILIAAILAATTTSSFAQLSGMFAPATGGIEYSVNLIGIQKDSCPATVLITWTLVYDVSTDGKSPTFIETFTPGCPLPARKGYMVVARVTPIADELNIGKDQKPLGFKIRYATNGTDYSNWSVQDPVEGTILKIPIGNFPHADQWPITMQVGVSAGKERVKILGGLCVKSSPNKQHVGTGTLVYTTSPEEFVQDTPVDIAAWQLRLLGSDVAGKIGPFASQTDIILAEDMQKQHIQQLFAAQQPKPPVVKTQSQNSGKKTGDSKPQPGDPDYYDDSDGKKDGDTSKDVTKTLPTKLWDSPWQSDGSFVLKPAVAVTLYLNCRAEGTLFYPFDNGQIKGFSYSDQPITCEAGQRIKLLASKVPSGTIIYVIYSDPTTGTRHLVTIK